MAETPLGNPPSAETAFHVNSKVPAGFSSFTNVATSLPNTSQILMVTKFIFGNYI